MNMTRKLVLAFFSVWSAVVGVSTVSAAEKTIEAKATLQWDPTPLAVMVGDVVEWKLGGGSHGVHITNWAAVKDHVEVETVAGQQPFNAETGKNNTPTNTAGKLLLRLKIKPDFPAATKITYECIVHLDDMVGEVSVAAAAKAVKVIEAKAPMNWDPTPLATTSGDVVEWRLDAAEGDDAHGVHITNWAAVKDHVEIETVAGQQPFNAETGKNTAPTNAVGKVLLRLKIKPDFPSATKITYECIRHLDDMVGEVSVAAAENAVKTIAAKAPFKWEPTPFAATVGDVVEWKLDAGTHGVRITNWAAVKDKVEVQAVEGQQPFNAETGQNDAPTNTAGKVLLRLKIKPDFPAPAELTYECIVHGNKMSGKITVAAGG